jgi:cadmium resistance protein CadD (predicted permease)
MSEERKGFVEITEGKEADTGAFYRGVLYVLAWIGVVFFHNFLKENHIGGVLIWGPFYLGLFFLFGKINRMFRVYEKHEERDEVGAKGDR